MAVSGASGGMGFEAGHAWLEVPVPDLILKGRDQVDSDVKYPKLCQQLVRLRMHVADVPQLLKRVVYVSDPDPFPLVGGIPPILVLACHLLWVHVWILNVLILGAVNGHIVHVQLGTGSLAF